MPALLTVEDLATHFTTREGTVKAVDGVSFEVEDGEILGLVGESGCGKSVTALSIMRLVAEPPGRTVGGRVLFQGRDLLALPAEQMRKVRGNDIAMVFQEPMTSLNPVLSIGRQLTEQLQVHLGMTGAAAERRAVELLELVGVPDAARRLKGFPHQLSGGMRQRVMIAMAISCEPRLIIADEPTTALDVTIQAQTLELMQRLCRDLGTALIIITHNLGVVARYARRVVVMYAGKVIERGTARELYADPRHPYTEGLLHAVPRLDRDVAEELATIEGAPPALVALPPGCSFAPRCRYADQRCRDEEPTLQSTGAGDAEHLTACWHADQVGALAAGSRV